MKRVNYFISLLIILLLTLTSTIGFSQESRLRAGIISTHSRYPFLIGYSNGSLGYLPTRISHSEGGYEPWSTRFDPAAEKIFVSGVEKILMRLQ